MSVLPMRLNDPVRVYEGEWYNEGHVVEITSNFAVVDFLDWKQKYSLSDLRVAYIHYKRILVPDRPGITTEDFRLTD